MSTLPVICSCAKRIPLILFQKRYFMKSISFYAAIAVLATTSLSAQEVLEGTISIDRVATASRTVQPVARKKSPAKTYVITAKTIQERGYQTVTEALAHEAGISVAANGGPGQPASLFFRGMSSSDVLVMIDGEPMVDYTQPSPAPFALESLRTDDVERIEVVQGAQSGAWGANAVAGAINIITKHARKDHAEIHIGAGTYGTRDWGFSTSQAGRHGSFSLSHNHGKTDGFSALAPMSAEADGYTYDSTHLKAAIKDDAGNTFGAFAHVYSDHFDYDSGFPADPNDTLGKGATQRRIMGLSFTHDRGGAFALKVRASLQHIQRHLEGAFGPFDTQGDRQAVSAVGTYRFAPDHTLSLGLERSTVSGQTTFAPASDFTNHAIFTDYTYTADDLLGAQTTFHAALRYDHFDRFADKATYRFGIKRNCNALPGLHTAANLYSAYKAPSLYQLSNAKAGTTLRPEYTTGYDVSIGYKTWLTATYFKNKTTDQIVNNAVWPAPAAYTNASGTQEVSGVELTSRIPVADTGLSLGANYTHLFQDHLVRRPQNSGNLFLDYRFMEGANFNLSLHYVGERDAVDGSRLAAYKTLDATVTDRINDHLNVSLGVKNLLGAHYQTAKGYNTPGRSVYARFQYTF